MFFYKNVGESNKTSSAQNAVNFAEDKFNWNLTGLSGTINDVEKKVNELEKKVETQKSTIWFLVLSIIWSFNTASRIAVKIKTDAKSYLPLSAQILLKVRYVFIFFLRVGSVVAYFSPFIGLKGIMNHWQAEKLPFVFSEDQKQFHFWNSLRNETQSVDIQELFRFSKASSNTVFFCSFFKLDLD